MATVRPFRALRPAPEWASRLCELPYDVISSEEARALAEGNPWSFLHVSKPEIDFPPGSDPCAPEVYAKGRENLDRLRANGALRQDRRPCFYCYRQVMGPHAQTGLVAVVSCQEYLEGIIRKHELTRVDNEDDRLRHIEALNAQTGPAFLTYQAVPALDRLLQERTTSRPEIDFLAADHVRHSAWTIGDRSTIRQIEGAFAGIPRLYIADGHHRSAAASRVYHARRGKGRSSFFLAVIFPHHQVQILPYHRVVVDLNGLSLDGLFRKLDEIFIVESPGLPQPTRRHQLALYVSRRWYRLTFRPQVSAARNTLDRLDVTLLQHRVLAPVFGIEDPRTSARINFVGGVRGPGELERLVDRGTYACAFSMFPTSIEDLMAIADAGSIMPPKSTWFEPKLRDGMFCHLLE